MSSHKLMNLNFKYDPNKDLTQRPMIEDYDNSTLYMYDLEKHLDLIYIRPLKIIILKFLNEWTHSSYKLLVDFKKISYKDLPSDIESCNFMKVHFDELNTKFNLNFTYDEKLFTTFNVLFFLKNMLAKINLLLHKEKIGDNKIYTILYKRK